MAVKDDADSYALDYAATAGQQAAFFREQAERHRREAARVRLSAEMSTGEEARTAQTKRAEQLETLGRHDDTMADAFEARARGPH